jgi:hypothetical protein
LKETNSQLPSRELPAGSKANASTTEQPPSVHSSSPQVNTPRSFPAVPPKGKRLPYTLMRLEPPQPVSVINANPVFEPANAATILGVSKDRLKKWR